MGTRIKSVQRPLLKADVLRGFFDTYSAIYDELVNAEYLDDVNGARRRLLAFVGEELGVRRGSDKGEKLILDVGCGTGVPSLDLILDGYTNTWGFDLSPGMISRLKTNAQAMSERKPESGLHSRTGQFWAMNWDNLSSSPELRQILAGGKAFDLILFRGAGVDFCESEDALKLLLLSLISMLKSGGKLLIGLRNWEARIREVENQVADQRKRKNKADEPRNCSGRLDVVKEESDHLVHIESIGRPILLNSKLHSLVHRYEYWPDPREDPPYRLHVDFLYVTVDLGEEVGADSENYQGGPVTTTRQYGFNNLMVTQQDLVDHMGEISVSDHGKFALTLDRVDFGAEHMAGNYHLHCMITKGQPVS